MHTRLPCVWNHENAINWEKEANSRRVTPFLVLLVWAHRPRALWVFSARTATEGWRAGEQLLLRKPSRSFYHFFRVISWAFLLFLTLETQWSSKQCDFYSCGISLPPQRQSRLDIVNEWCPAKCLLYDRRLVAEHILILCFLDFSILDDSSVF